MVPLLLPTKAQPLAGATDEANNVFQCEVNGATRHHFTNIHRMLHLAQKHPMVREAAPFKCEKVEGSKGHPHPISSAGVNPQPQPLAGFRSRIQGVGIGGGGGSPVPFFPWTLQVGGMARDWGWG